jgi:hypothetical protein
LEKAAGRCPNPGGLTGQKMCPKRVKKWDRLRCYETLCHGQPGRLLTGSGKVPERDLSRDLRTTIHRWTLLRQAIECWSKVLQVYGDSPDTAVGNEARQRIEKLEAEATVPAPSFNR